MKRQPTIAGMKLVGGHPALDFVNTVDCRIDRWGPDLLDSFDSLLVWALRVRLIDDAEANEVRASTHDTSVREPALGRAKALREAIFSLFIAESGEEGRTEEALDLLDQWVRRAAAGRRLVAMSSGEIDWVFMDAPDADLVTRRVALAAAELLLKRDRRKVRQCRGPHCGWLFLDTTRGGHRLWCASAGCGTRVRVKRYRAAH